MFQISFSFFKFENWVWKYFQINYPNRLLSKEIAIPLYVALVTDTGSFKYESTTADTHRMASNLIECGVDNYEIQRYIYEQKPISRVKVLGKAIEIIRFIYTITLNTSNN